MFIDNNISQGYKQTELGIIPEDWEVLSFSQVFDMLLLNCTEGIKTGIQPAITHPQNNNIKFSDFSTEIIILLTGFA